MYVFQEEPICQVWFSISLSLTPCGSLCIKILNISVKHQVRRECIYGCHLQGHAIVDSDSLISSDCLISNSGRRDLYSIPPSIAHLYIQMNTDFVFPALSTRKKNGLFLLDVRKSSLVLICRLPVSHKIDKDTGFLSCMCVCCLQNFVSNNTKFMTS